MTNFRVRPKVATALYALVLLELAILPSNARAADYVFTPLVTVPGLRINQLDIFNPTINNAGVVAYIDFVASNMVTLVLDDGTDVQTFDLNAVSDFSGVNQPSKAFINDAGAVGFYLRAQSFGAPAPGKVLRINPDDTVTTLATTNTDGVTGDLIAVNGHIAMNNAGQIAAEVTFNSGEHGVALIDDNGVTEIDTVSADRFNFVGASINDDGVVAFKAQETTPNIEGGNISIFVGDGSAPAVIGLPLPAGNNCGNVGAGPDINNNDLIAGQHPNCLVVGSGGFVTDVIVDESMNPFSETIGRLSLNDQDQIVFATSVNNNKSGLYFGDDPVNDKLIDEGDMLFGEAVGNPTGIAFCCGPAVRFGGEGGFNDVGQVVFTAATVSDSNEATSYLLRADPVGTDSDSDGVLDDADNCTEIANADQRDTNGDGIGNACDADLDNNCQINFLDLGILKSVFFSADPDADFDGNGAVNFLDLGFMKATFFGAPGPSGVANACE